MTTTTKPRRIQLRRKKGWRMPPNTVKVDRSTPWGNPFVTGDHGTQRKCVELYIWLLSGHACLTEGDVKAQMEHHDHVKDHIHELRGKNLACWCRKGTPCHADVLLEVANSDDPNINLDTWFDQYEDSDE